ncbi:unnamed protein product [Brassica oleracea]
MAPTPPIFISRPKPLIRIKPIPFRSELCVICVYRCKLEPLIWICRFWLDCL